MVENFVEYIVEELVCEVFGKCFCVCVFEGVGKGVIVEVGEDNFGCVKVGWL